MMEPPEATARSEETSVEAIAGCSSSIRYMETPASVTEQRSAAIRRRTAAGSKSATT
jgi:hypothetical protein